MENASPADFIEYSLPLANSEQLVERSQKLYRQMDSRRSCRHFSSRAVSKRVIQKLIHTAASAPSGAHKQPWTFVAVSNTLLKKKIRAAAEKEEKEFYESRATEEWLQDLAPLGTTWQKPFLEEAPWLIVVFKKSYQPEKGRKHKNYYVNESVGIACGFLISALHQCGLATLTHTPSPMNFLSRILERPPHEKPFLLLPVGFPADDATVPRLKRKSLNEIAVFY